MNPAMWCVTPLVHASRRLRNPINHNHLQIAAIFSEAKPLLTSSPIFCTISPNLWLFCHRHALILTVFYGRSAKVTLANIIATLLRDQKHISMKACPQCQCNYSSTSQHLTSAFCLTFLLFKHFHYYYTARPTRPNKAH